MHLLVLEQFELQGAVGFRDVQEGIRKKEAGREKPTSTMLIQEETAALKQRIRTNRRRALESVREGHDVLARDAVWAQDATHLGRLGNRREMQAEVATDRATLATVTSTAGPPARGEAVCAGLEAAKAERGGLPLVWQSDLGSANESDVVAAYLDAHLVIHLRSRVHTPTDNPVAEHKNRELKDESGLGQGVRLKDEATTQERLEAARRRIDHGRLRASRGWKTAADLDRQLPRADTLVPRAQFYAEARLAIREAVLGLTDPQEMRRAEQDAIWETLERHGLARHHVGLRPVPRPAPRPVTTAAIG